jgi:uncharacterized damage-inducible protein DinB
VLRGGSGFQLGIFFAVHDDVMQNLLIDLDREIASTRRLLERYPDGKGAWQPHSKSRTLSGLATHVASILHHGVNILTTAEMDVATRQPQPPKDSAKELLEVFEAGVTRLRSAIADTDAAKLGEKWTMRMGPRVLVSEARAMLMRLMVINHLVHHRAQLGVYLRLLDVPIPGMYGPSADEPV